MKKTEREMMLETALVAAGRQVLIAELKGHPALKNCPNVGLVTDVIIADHHYGSNQETGTFLAHYDEEHRYPSGRQLPEIITTMTADPETAFLFQPAAPKWERPKENPWRRDCWNLTLQCVVTKNDPELAEELKAEAKRREHALRRASTV